MTTSTMQPELDDLRTRVAGTVTGREDPGYDAARAVWNGMVDRRPWAVVRAADVRDVAPTVAYVREHGLDLAIRGGGHHVAGNGAVDHGVVLDLADVHAVSVDAAARTVRVGAGATLAHIDAATEPHGLVVPIGVVSSTGIAGLTLGGGVGWLTRPHGLTADNLVAVELVTADGRQVTASETEHPDLFWALHGGGGNFGVVTAFTFRAHPHGPQLFAGNLVYRQDRWRQAWTAVEEWTRDLPDAMTVITTTLTPPPVAEMGTSPSCSWASRGRLPTVPPGRPSLRGCASSPRPTRRRSGTCSGSSGNRPSTRSSPRACGRTGATPPSTGWTTR
jgi:FAD/FMN-containing dehydrogenase